MNEEQIRQILQSQRSAEPRRKFRCPEENKLAEYVDGRLSGSERTAFERHTSDCQSCLEAIAFLTRSAEWTDSKEIPAYLVARARGLVTQKAPVWRWRWAIPAVAAVCLVLALSFLVFRSRVRQPNVAVDESLIAQNQQTPPPVVVNTPAEEPPRPLPSRSVTKPNLNQGQTPSVRRIQSGLLPRLLVPREGSVLRRDELEFRWEPVSEAAFYRVRLATADGSLVREMETREPTLKLADDVKLTADANYYVTVVAHTSDGRATKSEIVRFRLAKD